MHDTSTPSKVAFLIASLNRQLQKEMEQRLHPLKIPMEQIRVIEVLSDPSNAGGVEMTALARLAVIDPSTLTKVIDRMISEGLVYRAADPRDRRRVRVLLTQEGVAIFEQMRPYRDQQEAELQMILQQTQAGGDAGDLSIILERLCQRQIVINDDN
jgi:DNA-binding MarR family transcriptional regulator